MTALATAESICVTTCVVAWLFTFVVLITRTPGLRVYLCAFSLMCTLCSVIMAGGEPTSLIEIVRTLAVFAPISAVAIHLVKRKTKKKQKRDKE